VSNVCTPPDLGSASTLTKWIIIILKLLLENKFLFLELLLLLLLLLLLSWSLIVYYDIVVLVVKLFTLKGAIINWRFFNTSNFIYAPPQKKWNKFISTFKGLFNDEIDIRVRRCPLNSSQMIPFCEWMKMNMKCS